MAMVSAQVCWAELAVGCWHLLAAPWVGRAGWTSPPTLLLGGSSCTAHKQQIAQTTFSEGSPCPGCCVNTF